MDLRRLLTETFVAAAEHHAKLPSTNDRAREVAAGRGATLPLLVLADRQTAGRGRGSKRWWTGPGALAFSLLLDVRRWAVARQEPLVGLAAALAVVEAVEPLLPGQTVGIHWPNDVFVAGGKLSGVLVERLAGGRCVIGIGLNANNSAAQAPEELEGLVITLRDLCGAEVDTTELMLGLLRHLESALRLLAFRPAAVAERADQACLQQGRQLSVRQGPATLRGWCAGIAPDGALLLRTAEGEAAVYRGMLEHDERTTHHGTTARECPTA